MHRKYIQRYRTASKKYNFHKIRSLVSAPGEIHFSMQAFTKNVKGLSDKIKVTYGQLSNVPAMPWCSGMDPPGKPVLSVSNNIITFEKAEEDIRMFNLYEGDLLVAKIGNKEENFDLNQSILAGKNVSRLKKTLKFYKLILRIILSKPTNLKAKIIFIFKKIQLVNKKIY